MLSKEGIIWWEGDTKKGSVGESHLNKKGSVWPSIPVTIFFVRSPLGILKTQSLLMFYICLKSTYPQGWW